VIDRVALPPALRAEVLRAARDAGERECCGLISGALENSVARIVALHPARNRAECADRFEIDPQDQFDALRRARAAGHAIVGCYHSHPGGKAEPSAADLAGAGEEDFVWLIAAGEVLAAFVYRRGGFDRLAVGADWVTSSL
jgi:proteasome lid subunit RPN8/RPN11